MRHMSELCVKAVWNHLWWHVLVTHVSLARVTCDTCMCHGGCPKGGRCQIRIRKLWHYKVRVPVSKRFKTPIILESNLEAIQQQCGCHVSFARHLQWTMLAVIGVNQFSWNYVSAINVHWPHIVLVELETIYFINSLNYLWANTLLVAKRWKSLAT